MRATYHRPLGARAGPLHCSHGNDHGPGGGAGAWCASNATVRWPGGPGLAGQNRNALSSRLLAELTGVLDRSATTPGSGRSSLTAEGPVFCSGADLTERLADPGAEHRSTLPDVLDAIVHLPQPVVAEVNGHARAGGLGLIAACDLAVAPASATFAFSEVRVGVTPAIIAVPALRVMTRRSFARYALTGESFSAARGPAPPACSRPPSTPPRSTTG